MSDAGPPPPHFGEQPHGASWSALPPKDDVEEETYEVAGPVIRFMPDHGVSVPLWDADGLLPWEPEWLERALGLSPDLVADIEAWTEDWNDDRGQSPRMPEDHAARQARLGTEAAVLVDRISSVIPDGLRVDLRLSAPVGAGRCSMLA